jgi:hypothetical protein
MLAVLALAALLQAQVSVPSEFPVSVVERVDCSVVNTPDGSAVPRVELTLRNVHDANLVAWTVRWDDPAHPGRWSTDLGDAVLTPRSQVKPGQSLQMVRNRPCVPVEVVGAVYSDGAIAGTERGMAQILNNRTAQLRGLQMLLSVLRTTRHGEAGVDSRQALEALLSGGAGPGVERGRSAALAAISSDQRTAQLMNANGPREPVSKVELIRVFDSAAETLEKSTHVSHRRRP